MAVKCEQCGHEHSEWVPRARLNERAEEVATLTAARDEALAKAALAARVPDLEAQLTAARQDVGLVRLGLDDEGIQVARTLYKALPDDKRPDDLASWVTSPDAPRAVKAYIPAPAPAPAPAATPAPTESPKPAAAPSAPPGTAGLSTQAPSAGATIGARDIERMSDAEYEAWAKANGIRR